MIHAPVVPVRNIRNAAVQINSINVTLNGIADEGLLTLP